MAVFQVKSDGVQKRPCGIKCKRLPEEAGVLCVQEVVGKDSIATTWNANHAWDKDKLVLPGDRVIAINGIRGDAHEMLRQTRLKSKNWEFWVKRGQVEIKDKRDALLSHFNGTSSSSASETPTRYTPPPEIGEVSFLSLHKPDDSSPLGISLFVHKENDFTIVQYVKDSGLVPEWNEMHPGQQVQQGDRIISVNGFGGKGQSGYMAILDELRKKGTLHVIVKRSCNEAEDVSKTARHDGRLETSVSTESTDLPDSGLEPTKRIRSTSPPQLAKKLVEVERPLSHERESPRTNQTSPYTEVGERIPVSPRPIAAKKRLVPLEEAIGKQNTDVVTVFAERSFLNFFSERTFTFFSDDGFCDSGVGEIKPSIRNVCFWRTTNLR